MAQQSNEHLTTADLSAYLDRELTPAEMEACEAHLRSCQLCQAALADLRLTSALLSSMPRVAVPRSFTLPTNLVTLPETPDATTASTPRGAPTPPRAFRSGTLRVLSTLAAVLGLLLFLAGAFGSLPHGGVATSMNSSVPAAGSTQPTTTPASTSTSTPTRAGAAVETPTPLSTPPSTFGMQERKPTTSQSGFPPALDLGQTEGRLVIGAALFLLGLGGLLVTRLLRRPARR